MSDTFDDPKSGAGSRFPGGFRALVTQELTSLGLTIVKWYGDGLDCKAEGAETTYVGLSNLYRRVKTNEPELSREIVHDFLTHVAATPGGDEPMPETMEEAAPRLLARIGQPFAKDSFAKDRKSPWSQKLPGTALQLNLVIDFPHTMAYVTRDMMDQSETPPGDWLERGIANLIDRTPPDWLRIMNEENGVYCAHTNDSYDAARALILCEYGPESAAGWLLATPSRDWLFAMPVQMNHLQHVPILKMLAEKNFKREPYPISDEVYWLRPGRAWVPFAIAFEDDAVQVFPPEGFLEAIGGLETTADDDAELENIERADDDDGEAKPNTY